MSNKKLILSVVLGLQALQGIAQTLAEEAIDVDEVKEREKLLDLFGKIKADLAERKQPKDCKAPEPDAPTYNNSEDAPVTSELDELVNMSQLDNIMSLLNDKRYTLRSFKAIEEATGLEQDEVCHLLDAEGIVFVVKHKDNGDAVVGLESRN